MKRIVYVLIVIFFITITLATRALALDLSEFIGSTYAEPTKTISMDFQNAALNTVLKIFSQQSGLNFIASDNVAGMTINLYLDNVPVEETLERILSANNLTYEIKPGSNIFVVKRLDRPERELITRVYKIKHAILPSSKLNNTFEITSTGDDSGGSGASQNAGIVTALEEIITEEGSITEDTRTNSLIITDIPTNFNRIENTLARLDVRIPLILIEVEMLDVNKTTTDTIGFQWDNPGFLFQSGSGTFPIVNGLQLNKDIFEPSTITHNGFDFVLNYLRVQSDTKVLSRPRILTLNNETAEINISADEAIGRGTTTTETTGTSTTEAERAETGVVLVVTPQANVETGDIILALEPRVRVAKNGLIIDGVQFQDVEERATRSILRMKDGNTVIIGGLIRIDSESVKSILPGFVNIPIIGFFFRNKDVGETERELIVFLTPHILKEDEGFQTAVRRQQIVREQDMPSRRLNKVNRALAAAEKGSY